jgi:hypothetical protein
VIEKAGKNFFRSAVIEFLKIKLRQGMAGVGAAKPG